MELWSSPVKLWSWKVDNWIWAVWDESEPDREDSEAEVTQSYHQHFWIHFLQVDDGSEYDSDESGEGEADGMGEEEEEEDLEFEEN